MSHGHIITQSTAKNFTALFDSDVLLNCNDVETLIQLFNEQCSSILDIVAPYKSRQLPSVKSSPWINDAIRNFRWKCIKAERLWKGTKQDVHRLNDERRYRAIYFVNFTSTNKINTLPLKQIISHVSYISKVIFMLMIFSCIALLNLMKVTNCPL